jgi:hypothetical protein
MPAEPALVALPALNAKFTVFAERVRVSDSAKVAFKAIVCAPEFSCADAIEAGSVIAKPTIAAQKILPVFIVPPNVGINLQFFAIREGPADAWHLVTFGEYVTAITYVKQHLRNQHSCLGSKFERKMPRAV